MDLHYQLGDEIMIVEFARDGEGMHITIADRVYQVSIIHSQPGEVTFTVDGTTHTAFLASAGSTQYVAIDGEVFELRKPDPRRTRRKQHRGEGNLTASMPGQITKVLVNAGDVVRRGQPLIVLEAMKMEIKISASRDGRVMKVLVQQGQVVDRGQELIDINQE